MFSSAEDLTACCRSAMLPMVFTESEESSCTTIEFRAYGENNETLKEGTLFFDDVIEENESSVDRLMRAVADLFSVDEFDNYVVGVSFDSHKITNI